MTQKTKERSAVAEKPAIVASGIVRPPSEAAVPRRGGSKQLSKPLLAFFLMVILPVAVFAAYMTVATERYAAGSSFVVRSSSSGGGGGDFLDTMMGSVSSGSTKSDSYIVSRYIESPDLARAVHDEFNMDTLYGPDRADRIQSLNTDATFEDKVKYWNSRALSTYDHTTGILTLEIQAYSPDDAKNVSEFVVARVRDLVNNLSRAARENSYEFALIELESSEGKLREAQVKLKEFRSTNGISDPSVSANRDDMLIFELNKMIVEKKTDLEVLLHGLEKPGYNATNLKRKIEALENQRDIIRKEIAEGQGGSSTVSAAIMNDYEILVLDVDIAKARYTAMLEGMESARREADRQQRYLAVFSEPYVADEARYPRRIINVLIALFAASMLFAVTSLVFRMVRDHQK